MPQTYDDAARAVTPVQLDGCLPPGADLDAAWAAGMRAFDDDPRMRRFNASAPEFTYDDSRPPGYKAGSARLGPALGASRIAATVYELPTGESTWPYHYEYGAEEWAIVLDGRPTLRHPEGDDELAPGDVVCFPDGPGGAHKFTNRAEETARLMIFSTAGRPAVAVFPDSDKIGVWPNGEEPAIVRRDLVGYWDGES